MLGLRYIGCHRKTCGLCINNPRKSCLRQLDTKYIVSDTLRAPCGAELYLQLHGCNEAEGAMDWTMPNNLHAQVTCLQPGRMCLSTAGRLVCSAGPLF